MADLRKAPLLALAAGVVSATGFEPLHLWPVTILAVVVLLELVRRASTARRAFLLAWLFALGQFALGLNWIATAFTFQASMPAWLGWVAVVLLSLYLAVWPAAAALGAWLIARGRRVPLVFAFAALWVATEWCRGWVFTGFPWNPLGVIWVGTPIEGLARWIGTHGLSALVILIAGARPPRSAAQYMQAGGIALLCLILLIANFLLTPLTFVDSDSDPYINARIVQPNIGQQDKWSEAFEARNFALLAKLSGHGGNQPRLLLWPEAAVPNYLEEEPDARFRLGALLGPRDLLLTGGTAIIYDRNGNAVGARNSVFALDAPGNILARYDKAHLVPYGEYLPMRPLLSAIGLSRLAPGDLDFLPGPGPRTVMLPGYGSAGLQLCYEIIFSGHVVDRAHRPAFLFNPSNDAWFGAWGPPQHLAQARLRAIEEAMPIVRATPTGISAVIAADGSVLNSLPWRKAGAIDARIPIAPAATLFAAWGNALPLAFAALLLALAIAIRARPR